MKQFDVFENPASGARHYAPYVVVLSSHLLMDFDDAVVAPLVNDATRLVSDLEIAVDLSGEALTLVVVELSTLRAGELRRRVASLRNQEFEIRRALDRLFTGF